MMKCEHRVYTYRDETWLRFSCVLSIINNFSIYYQRFTDGDLGLGYKVDTNGHRVKIQKYNELWR